MQDKNVHFHPDELGILRRCYHQCRHWVSPGFLAGFVVAQTFFFFPEHSLWEKVWPFYRLTDWMESLGVVPMWLSIVIDILWILAVVVGFTYTIKRGNNS